LRCLFSCERSSDGAPHRGACAARGADAASLARDMIEVHGGEAVTIARHNARAAALASQPQQAKSWLRVVDLIQ